MPMVIWLGGGATQPAPGLAREIELAVRGRGSWRRPDSPGGSPHPTAGRSPTDVGRARASATGSFSLKVAES